MVLAVCVVTEEGGGIFEVKNLAVAPEHQKGVGPGYAGFCAGTLSGLGRFLQVGTGESPLTVPFYQRCGFVYSHRIPDFFTQYYMTIPL